MGTMLNARGASFEACFDALNLTRPALVAEVHREYIEAGANIIQTNTFGANRYKLGAHGLEGKVAEINQAGVELARRVIAASFQEVLVAGDLGPLGVRLARPSRPARPSSSNRGPGAPADLLIWRLHRLPVERHRRARWPATCRWWSMTSPAMTAPYRRSTASGANRPKGGERDRR
jgi:hypothetical protein